MVYQILAIDDNNLMFKTIKQEWERYGALLTQATSIQEALHKLSRKNYSMIVIISRHSLAELLTAIMDLKVASDLPILVLAEQYTGADKITAICHGADDYQAIPNNVAEAAVSGIALIRMNSKEFSVDHEDKDGLLKRGGLIIDTARHTVKRDGQNVTLTVTEFKLLVFLARHEGIVFTQDELYWQVWKPGSLPNSNISNHIYRLRLKIEPDPNRFTYIRTVYGRGYKFLSN